LACRAIGALLISSRKQGAAVGDLEQAQLVALGAGKGALAVAEQLAFDQVFRDRRAVDGNEGLVAALAALVDLARHQFLAAAAFAKNQHAGIVGGGGIDQAVDAFLRLRLADDLAAFLVGTALLAQPLVLGGQLVIAERLFHHAAQLDGVERFLHVIVGAFLEGGDGGLDGGKTGNKHDLNLGVARLDELEQVEAVGAGHAQVGEDDGDVVVFQELHRLVRILGAGHPELHRRFAQHGEDQLAHVAVVLGDQNGRRHVGRVYLGGIQYVLIHSFARSRSTAGSLITKRAPSLCSAS
jgi:hypothetical protein